MSNINNISILIGRKANVLSCVLLTDDNGAAIDLFKDLRAKGGGGYSDLSLYRRGGLAKRASFDAVHATAVKSQPAAATAPKAANPKGNRLA